MYSWGSSSHSSASSSPKHMSGKRTRCMSAGTCGASSFHVRACLMPTVRYCNVRFTTRGDSHCPCGCADIPRVDDRID